MCCDVFCLWGYVSICSVKDEIWCCVLRVEGYRILKSYIRCIFFNCFVFVVYLLIVIIYCVELVDSVLWVFKISFVVVKVEVDDYY